MTLQNLDILRLELAFRLKKKTANASLLVLEDSQGKYLILVLEG